MDGIVRVRTITFTPDRMPTLRRIRLGYEGDNLVERLEFDLPEIAQGQTAMLMITGADAVKLDRTEDGRYAVDLTRDMIGPDGEREAYVRIDGAGEKVWKSAPMRMVTGALPDVEEEIEKVYPTAVGQMLTAMAEHSGEMEAQEERVEQAAQRAEDAAERAEAGGGSGSGGSTVEIDATLTQEGKAADAKATGEAIGKLSKEIVNQTREKPLVYIDGTIPTTKDNVLATMTVKSKWLNIFAYIKIKCQGSSSMSYPKKNFTVTLYQDAERTIPLYITIPGWKHPSNKFVLKANYIDHLHARNIVTARLWSEVVASRPDYDTLPEEFRNSPNNGAVNGFPIIVYANGNYQGVYTWNIGKDAWLWGMNEDNPNHVLMCGEINTDGTFAETPCNFRALWSGVDGTYWSVEVGTNSDAVKNALNALITCVKDTTDEEFAAQIGEYLDVQSAIDYYLFTCANCGIDSLAKNLLLGTYDLKKWILGQYDLDSTWGLWWDGSKFIDATTVCPDGYQEAFSLLFERISAVFKHELVARGLELGKTVLSYANIVSQFERFACEIGAEAYADDLVNYPNIPSAENNNIWQIRNFVRRRLAYFNAWLEDSTESDYDAPYPLKNGVYTAENGSGITMTISNGNHVAIESTANQVFANFTKGTCSNGMGPYAYTDKLFTLKAGDVVGLKLKNIVVNDLATTCMFTPCLRAANSEIKPRGDIALSTIGSECKGEVTISEDIDIGSVNAWMGTLAGGSKATIAFDLYVYVNGERYV